MSQLSALAASTASAAETAYTNAAAGTIASESTDWPVSQMKDAILDTEMDLIREICLNEQHPYRNLFDKAASAVASGVLVPSTASDSTPFIGNLSQVLNSSTSYVMPELPAYKVRMMIQNSGTMFGSTIPDGYAITGGTIIHTASTAVVWGPAAARSTFSGNMRLKDEYRSAMVCGSLARLLTKEGQFPDAWKANAEMFAREIALIQNTGRTVATAFPTNN
jgi:hypothetical protein